MKASELQSHLEENMLGQSSMNDHWWQILLQDLETEIKKVVPEFKSKDFNSLSSYYKHPILFGYEGQAFMSIDIYRVNTANTDYNTGKGAQNWVFNDIEVEFLLGDTIEECIPNAIKKAHEHEEFLKEQRNTRINEITNLLQSSSTTIDTLNKVLDILQRPEIKRATKINNHR